MFTSKQSESISQGTPVSEDSHIQWDYSPDAISYIHERTQLNKGMILADINSGLGRLTKHFLKEANTVYCVESDKRLRQIAAEKFWKNRNFIEINGYADQTCIENQAVDVITCGNGIRDCEEHRAIGEFKRILKNDGWLVLIENFLMDSDSRHCIINDLNPEDRYPGDLMKFYYPHGIWERKEYSSYLEADQEEFIRLFHRISYSQVSDDEIINIFDRFSTNNRILLEGKTILLIGQPRF
ncbi:MAG: hypothetical protein B6241_07870 [Spirochaetaceae bacterium 4572_59]|nr:MAG: hypothetical protein B6241_07870 [Spirochaetaceae bacterium 4572_59]